MQNPISSLVPDTLFQKLLALDLLNWYELRNLEIRRKFRRLRAQQLKMWDAIDILHGEYPMLQEDTIRKIVYHRVA